MFDGDFKGDLILGDNEKFAEGLRRCCEDGIGMPRDTGDDGENDGLESMKIGDVINADVDAACFDVVPSSLDGVDGVAEGI